jgi:hypothetical protein
MSKQEFSSKWALWLSVTLLVVVASAMVARGAEEVEIPFWTTWFESGHADANAEAFRHWDEDEPPEVSTRCAKCHSTPGYLDFLGADGTEAGTVDNPAPIGTTVNCIACHNEVTVVMDSVVFPSGIEVSGLGASARCMQCHQGRESSVSVDTRIADANVPDDDTVSSALSFRNIHYLPAGATQLGAEAMGGAQYPGKSYDIKFAHVEGVDSCIDCHDQHSLEVKVEICSVCHEGVNTHEELENIRFMGSTSDYDGDGDVAEGINDEIAGLQEILYGALRAYAAAAGTPIVYDAHSYPYFFVDANDNGTADEGEDRYNAFTASLVRATYNYQMSMKDHGAFAHNAKYMIQLLYDSIEDLDPTLVTGLSRDDAGHFAGSKEPFRHWDEDGEVSASCSKCHSATGLPFYLEEGITLSEPVSNGFMCTTCHDAVPGFTRHVVNEVEFPSGAVVSLGEGDDANLCISCHQGRQSTVSVDDYIAGKGATDDDTVDASMSFRNVHYYPAGATLFGTEAKGAYEYEGKVYNGRFPHVESFDTCAECHDAHDLGVKTQICSMCHGVQDPHDIRRSAVDFDGDGDTQEGLAGEIKTLHEVLYAAIQDYAANVAGTPIVYGSGYPYIFIDTNNNGVADEDEVNRSNRYNAFTVRLLQATYNYQYVKKDPGAFAHNGKYIIQVLYDSLEDLGADMTGLVRP